MFKIVQCGALCKLKTFKRATSRNLANDLLKKSSTYKSVHSKSQRKQIKIEICLKLNGQFQNYMLCQTIHQGERSCAPCNGLGGGRFKTLSFNGGSSTLPRRVEHSFPSPCRTAFLKVVRGLQS